MNKILHIKNKQRCSKTYTKQSGFSLIEIMVAALVLSIGILGVASLQIIGMKGTHQSYMKQQAMAVVQSLSERMHTNKQGVIAGNYLVDSSTFDCNAVLNTCSGPSSNCTVVEIATVDLHNLICGYKKGSAPRTGGVEVVDAGDVSTLVNGELDVTCPTGCATGEIRINVQWSEREFGTEDDGIAAGMPTDSLMVTTRIVQ